MRARVCTLRDDAVLQLKTSASKGSCEQLRGDAFLQLNTSSSEGSCEQLRGDAVLQLKTSASEKLACVRFVVILYCS